MKTPIITMPADKAEEHYKEYLDIVKTRKEKHLEDLKKTYYHLSKERKILDIYEVFKQSGLNEQGEPKLAIAPANAKTIIFEKLPLGSGNFTEHERWSMKSKSDVHLPTGTFGEWSWEKKGLSRWKANQDDKERVAIENKVPIIPAHLMPKGDLANYYVLFEVKEWALPSKAGYEKGDPYLLKKINNNAFAVLAEWDLTDLEVAVIRGL